MEILGSDRRPSPLDPDRVRLAAEVRYASGEPASETYWFDVPERLSGGLARDGGPWLVVLAPLAATLGEPLRSRLPVDPLLLRGIRRALATWKGWFPRLAEPGVEAPTADGASEGGAGRPGTEGRAHGAAGGREGRPERGACLFSGGVDSFFTLLRHRAGEPEVPLEIHDLLTVGGLDVPLARGDELRRLADRTREVARETGTVAVPMATNVRETRWSVTDWTRLSHGALLAACGLVLGGRYARVLIPSSLPYRRSQFAWGSHPFVDPMLSTRATEIVYDGATRLRTEKTARIVESELALRMLRVCWVEGAADNCGRCAKCWRTMATLEVVGALDRCPAFPGDAFSVEGLAALRVRTGPERRMLERTVSFAEARGRDDVAEALREAAAGSLRRQRVAGWLERLRAAGLPARPVEALLGHVLAGTVR